ncbi:unnamed protein product [Oppiella nova]|uniref:Homeobox domain-containing protein n=1 Tax=Oppiella nova TaxID=334625 RepID=A0A7R9LE06_9ACAR|nr:unnamed protein product [Oppiella nova]CAG2162719.1 unnamed protein product [Oppiella nova]
MVKSNSYSNSSMPRSVSSSPINSDASIDINDDDEDMSRSPKREPLSSPLIHPNGSMNCSKPSKLSFSISRLLGANSDSKHNQSGTTSEGESESPSSLCSQCPSTENNAIVSSYPSSSSPDSKCQSHRMTVSPYDHLTGGASVIRVPAHRPPPTMPYTTHYPWLGPTPPTLIKDGLQMSSSPINSDASIDINDDDEDMSRSPKREPLSSPLIHPNGSMNCSKPSKLSFSISRLLGANSDSKHNQSGTTSEGESESPSSLCSQCPSTENNAIVSSYPSSSSPDSKCQSHRMIVSPYDHLTGGASVIRVPAHRPPPTMPYTTHYPWLGPTPPTLIKDGLQMPFPLGPGLPPVPARRIGHPYQNRTPPKRKKPRTSFTRMQICELEKRFHKQKYLASAERASLAKTLKMTDAQVKTWRQTAEEREAERQAANRLMMSLQAEVVSKSMYGSGQSAAEHSAGMAAHHAAAQAAAAVARDSLCLSSSSLHALQNLQPWGGDSHHAAMIAHHHHERSPFPMTSAMC